MDARSKRDLKLCGLALAVMAIFACLQLFAFDVASLRRVELTALDAQVRWRGPKPPGSDTILVMIDDRTVGELGQWPIARDVLADVVAKLRRAGAKVIAIDVLFAEPGPPDSDAALAAAIREAGNVVLPFTFEFAGASSGQVAAPVARAAYTKLRLASGYRPLALVPTSVVAPLPALAEVATLGHTLVAYDVDGSPRYEYPALALDLEQYPSMSVRIVQRFRDVAWNDVALELGRGVSLGARFIPTDPQMRLLVDYLGPPGAFPTHSLSDVLRGRVPETLFRDRIVLVGASAIGSGDAFGSPFTGAMPGVERLATIVDAMLHERWLQRPAAAPWAEGAAMLAGALLLGLAVSRLSLALAAIATIVLAVAWAGAAQVALARLGIWQASVVPIVALVTTFIGLSLYRYGLLDRERRHIGRVFQRYLSPQMVERLLSDEKLPELGGELRELTVLFCDLQGFTTLSERLEPAALTRLVNRFLSAATEAVLHYGGTVDKYVGDCIMAFWNAPILQPDHAELACRAALRIVSNLSELSAEWAREAGLPKLAAGVGLNTGPCTVGNFGSSHRFDYSAIGDAVNVAARLESETRAQGFAILLGPETAARVPQFATVPLGPLHVRGRREMLDVHALIGDEATRASASFIEFHAHHVQQRFGVPEPHGPAAASGG